MFTLLTVLDEAEYVSYTSQKLKAKLMAWFRQQLTFWLPQPTCNSELVFSSQLDIGKAVETAFDACTSETKILHEAAAILCRQIKQVHSSAADMQILMHVTFVMFDYDDTGEIKQLKPILHPITAYRTMLLYKSVSWRRWKWRKSSVNMSHLSCLITQLPELHLTLFGTMKEALKPTRRSWVLLNWRWQTHSLWTAQASPAMVVYNVHTYSSSSW